ncbi:MAG: type IX secretion system membrane protein PorP/SprF [Bacteroidales bacterium]|nr:type IX secretion system membrane protein PorP/SprF [Bacteroidales bacterium]
MRRAIKYSFVVFLFLCSEHLFSQQMPQFSQFMENKFIINPGVAGTSRSYEIRSINRFQWAGFTDAPQTYTLSVSGPSRRKSMGFGGYVYSDIQGPSSRTGFAGSYAYNIAISEDIRMSGGLSLGMLFYKFDRSKINFGDDVEDPAVLGSRENKTIPDVNIGFFLYSSSYYVGVSLHQLISTRSNLAQPHIFINGGYLFMVNRDIVLEPSILFKYTWPSSPQPELNIKAIYDSRIWGGVTFRTFDAVGVMLGYVHDKRYFFGYSFDFSYNTIGKYSSGSHEIMVGVKFTPIK